MGGRGSPSNTKLILFVFFSSSSSLSSYHHPGQGHHQTRCVFGMATAWETQWSHSWVRGQVLREGEKIHGKAVSKILPWWNYPCRKDQHRWSPTYVVFCIWVCSPMRLLNQLGQLASPEGPCWLATFNFACVLWGSSSWQHEIRDIFWKI